jgi:hypothetical protein
MLARSEFGRLAVVLAGLGVARVEEEDFTIKQSQS